MLNEDGLTINMWGKEFIIIRMEMTIDDNIPEIDKKV
jgi:hypothetical protein